MARLENKVCIITGVGGAIGSASAIRFAEEGALVVGCDISSDGATRVSEEVNGMNGTMVALNSCDLTKAESCEAVVKLAMDSYGRVDVLFNNAGKVSYAWLDDAPESKFWYDTIDGELNQVFLMTRAAWPALSNVRGVIINMASTAGHIAFQALGGLGHCAAKGGVLAMTRQLAMEGRKHGVRVNSISPGVIETPSTVAKSQDPDWARMMIGKSMQNRLGKPREIANVALFLASHESSLVNGADLIADGGATAW